jgi:hypothetical protein
VLAPGVLDKNIRKNHDINVNSNQTSSQQIKKKFPVFFPFIGGVVDTDDQPLLSNISENFHKN